MDTEPGPASRRRRRPWPLRLKIAIAGILGLTAAWLIPKGGGIPLDNTTPTPTPPNGVTAVEEPLSAVHPGVSFRVVDGVRIFLSRTGDKVIGFQGLATTTESGPVHWCPPYNWFEGDGPGPYYDSAGGTLRYSAPRNLDKISVLVAAGRVTIFPHQVLTGSPAPPTPAGPRSQLHVRACAADERVG